MAYCCIARRNFLGEEICPTSFLSFFFFFFLFLFFQHYHMRAPEKENARRDARDNETILREMKRKGAGRVSAVFAFPLHMRLLSRCSGRVARCARLCCNWSAYRVARDEQEGSFWVEAKREMENGGIHHKRLISIRSGGNNGLHTRVR